MKTLVGNQKYLVLILVTVLIAVGTQSSSGQTITASVDTPLTEPTLDESVVTLTLSGAKYARSIFDIRDGVSVSGVDGVTIGTFGVDRESDTEITVELEFEGDFDTDATLTFTVGADAIANYNGATLTAQVSVTAMTESVVASTVAPLTESTLDETVVTLTLNGANYASSTFDIDDGLTVSGIDGVTYHWFDLDRVSDTVITVGLQFNGNIDSNGTLTFTVGADAIAGYNGDALTATLPVTALTESVTASTATPLTEATLNGSIVTLTLNNGVYEIWNRVRNNLTVSGITGVRFISSQDVVRVSDTKVTISLRFNGNIDTDATLTFTVGADAIANYNGSALTAQVSVTALTESVTASTATPLTEATLNGSIVTLTLNNGVYESWNPVRNNLTVSGITGVRFISSQDVVRVSDTKVTISLRFNGNNIDTDATLTFTVGAAAIEGYSGDALTATLLVTALPNRAPVFSGGASTTRTVAENTGAGVNIGSAVSATDADNDTLTYTLSGTDATSFDIVSTSGQLQTKATLDYETKTSYTVTVTVSDGSLADSITVTINVTDLINEQPATYAVGEEVTTLPPGSWLPDRVVGTSFSLVGGNLVVEFDNGGQLEKDGMTYTCVANGGCKIEGRSVTKGTIQATSGTGPINRAPVFTAGASTTRTVAEDTGAGVNIGSAVSATDVDNDTLTYTLSGTDAASFDIVNTSGQLRTKSALDYKTTPYTVTVTVSDGSLTDSITVSITVTEVTEETVSASTPTSLTEATVDESVVTLTLTGGTYEQSIGTIRNNVTVSGIAGVTARSSDVRRVSDTVVRVELTFDGTDFDTDATLTFTVGAAAVADYTGVALTAQVPVTALEETVTTSTPAPLTEVTLDESVVTLTLSGRVYGSRSTVENNVTVSGIDGVTIGTDGIDRESDTAITVQLEFDGDLVADAHLTFTVGAGAIANYNGSALTAILPVTTVEENSITVSLQKVGADQFKGIASSSTPFDIVLPLSVTNGRITGGATTVTIPTGSVESELLTVTRTPGTSDDITVDIGPLPGIPATHPGYSLVKSTDLPLPFITYAETSLMAIRGTITNQDGTPAGAGLQVTVTIGSTTKTATSEVEGAYAVIFLVLQGAVATSEDTVTVEVVNETTGASVEHTGPLSPEQITAKQATIDLQFSTPPQAVSLTASTVAPLTESTLDGSVVTLTLTGGTYESSIVTIRNAVAVSGIPGVTVATSDVSRVNDTKVTVELTFNGTDFDTNATLTLTVGAGAIAGYSGPALTASLRVTALTESVVASTVTPLTEATLDGSVVTLTLTGGTYESSIVTIRNAVAVSGIPGVTVATSDVSRVNDTKVTVELTFNGTDFDTNATLTLTVGAGAIAGYSGPAVTAPLRVTALTESVVASTVTPLTEATLDGSVVTLTLTGATYESSIVTIRNAVAVSGIPGVTVTTSDVSRVNDTKVTVELTFNGTDFDTNATLTLTVGAGAIAGYSGPAVTASLRVTALTESVVASTVTPLTEATLDGSVVTLTLNGATYESSIVTIRNAVAVSGITGVTVATGGVSRVSDTVITVPLAFDGTNLAPNATLTFTVAAGAIAGYSGPAVTVPLRVTALTESVVASTVTPLTEATLDGSVVTLTLNGATYASSIVTIRNAVAVSGIPGVTVATSDVSRVNDTKVTVELTFNGTDFDTNATLTLTVGAGAIAGYSGPALTASLRVTALTESVVASTVTPLTEATLDGSVVTLTLTGATYESSIVTIRNAVAVSGITGVTVAAGGVSRVSDTVITVPLAFDGTNLAPNATLTLTVGAGAIAGYSGPALTASLRVTALTESVVASTVTPLTEATLDGSVVTLTLNGATYASSIVTIRNAVAVSGITGVTIATGGVSRVSDTVITVPLAFDGTPLAPNATLTFTIAAGAIAGYRGPALTAPVSVTTGTVETTLMAIKGTITNQDGTPAGAGLQVTVTIGTTIKTAVSEADGTYSVFFFNFQGVAATSGNTVTVSVSNPTGASAEDTIQLSAAQIIAKQAAIDLQFSTPTQAVSVTASTVAPLTESTLNGSVVTLTLTGVIYESSIVTIRNAVAVSGITGVTVATGGVSRVSDTVITVPLAFDGTNLAPNATLTFTIAAGAIAGYSGPAVTASLRVTALTESVVASTATPLTEATLDGSVVTLTLTGATYESSIVTIRNAVAVSGITGVTVAPSGVSRVNDTKVTVELTFNGTDFDTNATLTLTVGAGAIAGYSGVAVTASLRVTALTESVVASTATPLTESTLDGSVVTLTLTGATYESSIVTIRNAVAVSGITGVTIATGGVIRVSDTVITVPLAFDGTNLAPNATLTFTVAAGAIAGYRGPAVTASLRVTALTESVVASTVTPLTEATLDGSVVTLTLAGAIYESSIVTIRNAVAVSGIAGVTVATGGVSRVSDTVITVPLAFDGTPLAPNATLTFTIAAGAIAGYRGPALTAPISVTTGTVETTLMAIKGTITNQDGTPAGAGLQVTVTIGTTIKTAVSEADGTYSVFFFNFQGVAATSGDTVTVSVSNPTGASAEDTIQLSAAQIIAKQAAIDLQFPLLDGAVSTPVSVRTPQVRDAIVAAVPGVNSANAVTAVHLAAIHTLSLSSQSITTLKAGDFDGFTALATLTLNNNALSTLPAGIFDKLTALTRLDLNNTNLSTLPSGIFDKLTTLTTLTLNNTNLSTLPAGIFDKLTALTRLDLNNTNLSTLPAGIFDKLTALTTLALNNTNLSTLPAGLFDGLTGLTNLTLHGNAVDPLPLTVSLERVRSNQFKAVAPTGAPFEIVLPLIVANGTINGGATTITIPKGRVESALLTVTQTPGSTFGVTANIGAPLPARPVSHTGYMLVKSDELPLGFPSLGGAVFTPVSERTAQVRDAIVVAVPGINSANDVTAVHVAAIHTLSLASRSITTLKAGDFDGFTALTRLDLNHNALSTLPAGIFDNLTALTRLALNNTALSTLPAGVFDNLTALTRLDLNNTALSTLPSGIFDKLTALTTLTLNNTNLSTLPAGIFDKLTALTRLDLNNTNLSTLPTGIFDKLTALTTLALNNTNLSTLPAGLFDGLIALTNLTLNGNAVDPLPLTVSLEQVEVNQFKAVAPTGAPFEIVLLLIVANGTIDSGATTITIPKGSVESVPLTITRTVGTTDAMSVDIGAPLPVRPVSHTGYTLVKSDDLPLTLITFAETSLMAIKGTVTYEDGSVAGAGLQVTVTIGSSTQTVDSKADGVYTAIFANFLGVVATSKDTVTVAVLSDTTGASVERTVPLSPEQIVANQATIDLQFSSTPSGTDREYLLSVSAGISLIHVPLKVTAVDGVAQTIESVGDLYDALGGSAAVELLITYDPETQRWNSYLHDGHRGRLGDKALTDDLGIIASMKVAKSVKLSGDALGTNGRSSITLHPGINLVGVPLKDSRITRVSDLLKLNGFAGNVSVIIVSDNGFKVVAQADDPGDIPVTGGGAFILTARNAATVEITGTKWSNPLGQTAAPSTALTGTQTDSVTPILAVTGSISSVGNKSLSRSFRVTVKNRSTGTVDTAMTDDDGVTYQFTFVDIERGRAAQVGDILEITAQSPDPFVGVQPLRHTVTVEDVKRSRIPLAELVAYEIPAKTELLLNYPNPFNPETWIPYRLAKDAFVTLTIYDQRGRVVRDIAVGHRIAAVYESRSKAIYWDGRTEFGERVASGIYFYTLTAGDYSATRKMVILK